MTPPPDLAEVLARLAALEQAVTRVREVCAKVCASPTLHICPVVTVADIRRALDGIEAP